MTPAELAPLASLPPDGLAAHLAGLSDPQAWIDDVFDVAEEHDRDNTAGLFNLAWAANDIALLLKDGAEPSAIRKSPYRGMVSDWRESDEITPLDRTAPGYVPPFGFAVGADGELMPERRPASADFSEPEPEEHYAHDVVLTCGADIRPEPIEWVWPGFLAAGKLEILSGAPGCGKTTIALSLAAILTTGGRLPDGSRATAADVGIWSAEDDAADTLAPRLLAAGADMRRVHFVSETVSAEGERRPFDPATDTGHLARALAGLQVRLLIIDPVVNAVSGDSHKNTETRRALQPLVDLASKLGCAVLGITHFSKGTQGRDPVERVTGSIAFGALARLVFAAAKAGDDDVDADGCDRLFVRSKSNIGPDGGGFRYALEQVAVPGHSTLFASRVRWGSPLEGEARALLATAEAASDPEEKNALADAVEFLRSLLTDGPQPAKTIRSDGENAGHTWRTMHRAADKLSVERKKEGMRGGWVWRLPLAAKMPTTPPEDAIFPEQEKLAPSESLAPSGDEMPF